MSFKDAVAGGGWLLAIATFWLGTIFGTAGGNTVVEQAKDLVANAPAAERRCPAGWEDTSVEADHALVYRCERGAWVTILNPDLSFSHARQGDSGPFEYDQTKVPGWPR